MRDGNCELYCQYILKDVDGKTLKKKTFKSKSFVKAFILMLYCILSGKGDYTPAFEITDVTTTARTITFTNTQGNSNQLYMSAGSTVTTFGVLIGSGVTAISMDDTAMETLIAHGTSAGELQYGAVSFGAPATTATETSFRVTRVFTNGSGGNVSVEETGIAFQGGSNWEFLGIRDNLPSTVTVADAQQLTINYTIKTVI